MIQSVSIYSFYYFTCPPLLPPSPHRSKMSRSSEGDDCGNSNIDAIDEKLQNMSIISMNGRDDDDGDDDDVVVVHGNVDGEDNECDSISEHEPSTMSQANYYDESSMNSLNHLFHIDFMRSMQNLRTQEKKLVSY